MANTDTNDIAGSIEQAMRCFDAGAELLRFTAQGSREAEAVGVIKHELVERGYSQPLVADIHFNPNVADRAAEVVDKVRINPGNYIDPARKFKHIDYTDEEYKAELERLRERFTKLLNICKQYNTAIRIGVNHGSLSDRIMSRYGDTSEGMVESCMEFLRVAVAEDFQNIVLSIKASNTRIMVQTVRLLVAAMDNENMSFPLHLGVTEAGEGEDGRIKSAVGIGALLAEGVGDTIRVSLSEAPEAELPVGMALRDYFTDPKSNRYTHVRLVQKVKAASENGSAPSVVWRYESDEEDWSLFVIEASAETGRLLWNRVEEGNTGCDLEIVNPHFSQSALDGLVKDIKQAAGILRYKTEYVSCPSCGRTLFNIENVIREVKAATSYLKGLKIAVMGCVVNGPGEMADADYGYVGAARGKVSLYRGKECVKANIAQEDAVTELVKLILLDQNTNI